MTDQSCTVVVGADHAQNIKWKQDCMHKFHTKGVAFADT